MSPCEKFTTPASTLRYGTTKTLDMMLTFVNALAKAEEYISRKKTCRTIAGGAETPAGRSRFLLKVLQPQAVCQTIRP